MTELTATVDAVDYSNLLVTLTGPQGNTVMVTAGSQVRNLIGLPAKVYLAQSTTAEEWRMRHIGATIGHEIRELLPAVLYFVITFNIIGFTKVLMLREYGITVSTFVGATLGALLVAKAVLIVGLLPFMEPFPRIPILYNVLWKTLLYALAALLIQVLEEVIRALLKHGGLAPAWDVLWRPHFWVIQIWLVMVLLIFCTFRELLRVLGPEKAKEIFLGIRSSHSTSDARRA